MVEKNRGVKKCENKILNVKGKREIPEGQKNMKSNVQKKTSGSAGANMVSP